MGRPRKPLEQQTRHNTVSERLRRQKEEESVKGDADQLKKPPEWLCNTVAREEWRRVVKELEKIVIVGNLDVTNIGAYCNAYAAYRASLRRNWLNNRRLLRKAQRRAYSLWKIL